MHILQDARLYVIQVSCPLLTMFLTKDVTRSFNPFYKVFTAHSVIRVALEYIDRRKMEASYTDKGTDGEACSLTDRIVFVQNSHHPPDLCLRSFVIDLPRFHPITLDASPPQNLTKFRRGNRGLHHSP